MKFVLATICLAAMACSASDVASMDAVELGEASDMIQLREEVARLKAENKELKEANSVTSPSLGESAATFLGAPLDGYACSQCAAGKKSNSAKTSCDNCAGGQYQPSAGKTSCSPCTAGKHSNSAKTACSWCANGKISANGASSCSSCAAGKKAVGRTSCNTCPAGTYTGANSITCHNCPNGKISANGASSCSSCAAGKKAVGRTSCHTCPDGTYTGANSIHCHNCPTGKYSRGSGKSQCHRGTSDMTSANNKKCTGGHFIFRRRAVSNLRHDNRATQTETNCKNACNGVSDCKYVIGYWAGTHRRRWCNLKKNGCSYQNAHHAKTWQFP